MSGLYHRCTRARNSEAFNLLSGRNYTLPEKSLACTKCRRFERLSVQSPKRGVCTKSNAPAQKVSSHFYFGGLYLFFLASRTLKIFYSHRIRVRIEIAIEIKSAATLLYPRLFFNFYVIVDTLSASSAQTLRVHVMA